MVISGTLKNYSVIEPYIATAPIRAKFIVVHLVLSEGLAVNIKGRLTHESALKMEIERPGVYNLVISSDPSRYTSDVNMNS